MLASYFLSKSFFFRILWWKSSKNSIYFEIEILINEIEILRQVSFELFNINIDYYVSLLNKGIHFFKKNNVVYCVWLCCNQSRKQNFPWISSVLAWLFESLFIIMIMVSTSVIKQHTVQVHAIYWLKEEILFEVSCLEIHINVQYSWVIITNT